MRDTSPDRALVSADLEVELAASFRGLVRDDRMMPYRITLTTPVSRTFDMAAGTFSDADVVANVAASMSPINLHAKGLDGDSTYQLGDVRLLVAVQDVTTALSTSTRITLGDDTYAVLSADIDPLGVFWRLTARKQTQGAPHG